MVNMGEDKRARSWELRHGAGRAGKIFRVPWELRLGWSWGGDLGCGSRWKRFGTSRCKF